MLLTSNNIAMSTIKFALETLEHGKSINEAGKRRLICEGMDAKGGLHNYVDSEANGENGLGHPHNKQLTNVVAWLVGDMHDRWYIKPRSTQ